MENNQIEPRPKPIFWFLLCVIDIFMLGFYYKVECDQPLGNWLIFRLCHSIIHNIYFWNTQNPSKLIAGILLTIGVAVFVTLNIIFYQVKSCQDTNVHIYRYVRIYLIYYYIITSFIVILLIYFIYKSIKQCFRETRSSDERRNFVRELAQRARTENSTLSQNNEQKFLNFTFLRGFSFLQDECSICLDPYKEDDNVVKLPCNHEFHAECIETWLMENLNCPICRRQIETSSV